VASGTGIELDRRQCEAAGRQIDRISPAAQFH
jgi:hypothetical protein